MHHGFNHYWDIFYLTAFLVKEDGSLDLDSVPVPVDWTGTFDFVALVHDEGEEGGGGNGGLVHQKLPTKEIVLQSCN